MFRDIVSRMIPTPPLSNSQMGVVSPSRLVDDLKYSSRHRQRFDQPAKPGPAIEKLPIAWQKHIVKVWKASYADIEHYKHARARVEAAARAYELTGEPAAEDAFNAAMNRALPTMRQSWHAIEMRLAHAFAMELAGCCAEENPRLFLEATDHFATPQESAAYIVSLLDIPAPKPAAAFLSTVPTMPNIHLATRPAATSASPAQPTPSTENSGSETTCPPSTSDAVPSSNPYTHGGTTEARLDNFTNAFEQRKPKALTLAEIVNGEWEEATQICQEHPEKRQKLPHMYSIIEDMLGQRKEVVTQDQQPPSRTWAAQAIAKRQALANLPDLIDPNSTRPPESGFSLS